MKTKTVRYGFSSISKYNIFKYLKCTGCIVIASFLEFDIRSSDVYDYNHIVYIVG